MKKIYKKPINKVIVVDSEELCNNISIQLINNDGSRPQSINVDESDKVKGQSLNLWDEEW